MPPFEERNHEDRSTARLKIIMVLARRRPTENIHTSALLEGAEKAPREDEELGYVVRMLWALSLAFMLLHVIYVMWFQVVSYSLKMSE